MLEAIAIQPKTPEEWDEARKYLNVCEKEVADMLVRFERTKTVWEISPTFQFYFILFYFDYGLDFRRVFVPGFAPGFPPLHYNIHVPQESSRCD